MKTTAKAPVLKDSPLMNIKGVKTYDVAFTFSQDPDTWQSSDVLGQDIKISTAESGGGSYIIIETERWAMDADEIDDFCDCLKKIVAMPGGMK